MTSSALLFLLLFSNLEQSGSHKTFLDRQMLTKLRESRVLEVQADAYSGLNGTLGFDLDTSKDNYLPASISSFEQSIWFGQYENLLQSPYNQYAHIILLVDRLIALDKIQTQVVKDRIYDLLKKKLPDDLFRHLSPFIEQIPVSKNSNMVEVNPADDTLVALDTHGAMYDARGENFPNEGVKNLFDGRVDSKWLDFSKHPSRESYASVKFSSPKPILAYELTSADDFPERDPKDWTLWGKSEQNRQWHVVDVQKDVKFNRRHQSLRFYIPDEPESFTEIKLEIHNVNNIAAANSVQLSRLRFFGDQEKQAVEKKETFGLQESDFAAELPNKSVNFLWDVSLYEKITKNPKQKLKNNVRHFMFDENFSLNSMKMMLKESRNDWSVERQIKRILEEGVIPEVYVEPEILPYFVNLCKYIWSWRYKDKLNNLRVIGEDGSEDYFFNKISSGNKAEDIERYFTDKSLTSLGRFELLKEILDNGKKRVGLSEVLDAAIDHKDDSVPLLLNDDNQKELKDFFGRIKRPEEIAVLSSLLFHLPQKDLLTYLQKHIDDNEILSDLLLCIKRMPSFSKKNLHWLFSRVRDNELLTYNDLSLKSELLEDGISAELLNKYNDRYSNSQKEIFADIIFEYISLSGDLQRDPMHELHKFSQENSRFKLPMQMLQGMPAPTVEQSSIDFFANSLFQKFIEEDFNQEEATGIIDGLLSQIDLSHDMGSFVRIIDSQLQTLLPVQDVQKIEWLDQVLAAGVDIAGIDLPHTYDPFDERLIPDEVQSDLIMTPTAGKVLRKIAGHWLSKSPAILEGSTSAGKTSYVQYVAAKTRTPMIRVNLSKSTSVQELLGRWVAGHEQYTLQELKAYQREQLIIIAKCLGADIDSGYSTDKMAQEIYKWQMKPHFQAGPVLIAMFTGSTIVLDEINLASNAVIEGVLNSLLDSKTVTVDDHKGELVVAHEDTRVFATMNPASYIGRNKLSDALKSRCTVLKVDTPSIEDIIQILSEKFPSVLDDTELQQLVSAHSELAKIAEQGAIGRDLGRISYTLRNLFRVMNRFEHFKDTTKLSRMELLRREFEEVYKSSIFNEQEQMIIEDALLLNMPVDHTDFYEDLEFQITPEEFVIGDIKVARKHGSQHSQTSRPEDLSIIMTKRTKKIFYQLVKALELGENVALVGEKASGKTMLAKYYSALKGQPFFRETFSPDTDNLKLIGKYTPNGFQYGPLIEAGHPEHEAGVYLADEINLAPDAIQERLNSLLDSGRSLTLTEGNGDLIKFHPDFRFVAAMNPPTRKYGGRKKMSQAMQNRLTVIFVESLENQEEFMEIFSAIGKSQGISKNIVQTLVSLHFWVKEQIEEGNIGGNGPKDSYVFSIRQIEMAFNALIDLSVMKKDIQQAFKLVAEIYYESMFEEEQDREAVRGYAEELCR